jgi:hypothetical protein
MGWYAIACSAAVCACLPVQLYAQACVPPPSGVIAWWPFDEISGTIVADIAGTKPAVHFGSPVRLPGKVGGSLRFNGSTDFVAAADSDLWAFGTGNFTIEFWANFDVPGHGDIVHAGDIFIGNDNGPGNINKWFFALGGGVLHFTVWNDQSPPPNTYLVRAPFSPVVGQWYHLAVTKTGQLFTIYVNGIAIGSEISPSPISNPSAPLTIGQAESLGFMNGRLDEMTVYNRALSQQELRNIVAAQGAGKCNETAPTTVWPSSGGDTGTVSLTISGVAIVPGAQVKLARAGNFDILATSVTGIPGSPSTVAMFQFLRAPNGPWDVVITNPGTSPFTLPATFSIEPVRTPQVWVDITGRGAIRVGQAQQFAILYGNRGNVDAPGAFVVVTGIPSNSDIKTNFRLSVDTLAPNNNRLAPAYFYESTTGRVVPFELGTIPAGFVGSLNMELTVNSATAFRLNPLVNLP